MPISTQQITVNQTETILYHISCSIDRGVIVGVSPTKVQWKGLTLGELPS